MTTIRERLINTLWRGHCLPARSAEMLDGYRRVVLAEAVVPRRGDAFEQWLLAQRAAVIADGPAWVAVDEVLSTYTEHAETGTPLDQPLTGDDDEAAAEAWQRAVDGLNALVDAGIPVAVALDGVIENPFGDEAIVWDRDRGRWTLTGGDEGALAEQRHQLDEIDPVFARLAPGYEVAEGRWTA